MNSLKSPVSNFFICSLTALFLDSCGGNSGATDEEARAAAQGPLSADKSVLQDNWGSGAYSGGLAVQSDDKILVVGRIARTRDFGECASAFTFCPLIVRYNSDGTRDKAYGTHRNGLYAPSFGSSGGILSANAVSVDSSGRAVISGYGMATTSYRMIAHRMTSAGRLDTSFTPLDASLTGYEELSLTNSIQRVAPHADKILVAGRATVGSFTQALIVRLGANGGVDTSFGTSGYVLLDAAPGASSAIYSVAEQADGKLVATGFAKDPLTSLNRLLLVRLNADGSLDTTFNTTGVLISDLGLGNVWGQKMLIQSNGDYVIAGRSTQSGVSQGVVMRYSSSGALDTAGFNAPYGYFMTVNADATFFSSLALDSSTLVATGSMGNYAVAMRLNSNGTLATSFGTNGFKTASSANGPLSQQFPMQLLSNGDIVQGGNLWVATPVPVVVKFRR